MVDSAPSRPSRTCSRNSSTSGCGRIASSNTVQYRHPDGSRTRNARITGHLAPTQVRLGRSVRIGTDSQWGRQLGRPWSAPGHSWVWAKAEIRPVGGERHPKALGDHRAVIGASVESVVPHGDGAAAEHQLNEVGGELINGNAQGSGGVDGPRSGLHVGVDVAAGDSVSDDQRERKDSAGAVPDGAGRVVDEAPGPGAARWRT